MVFVKGTFERICSHHLVQISKVLDVDLGTVTAVFQEPGEMLAPQLLDRVLTREGEGKSVIECIILILTHYLGFGFMFFGDVTQAADACEFYKKSSNTLRVSVFTTMYLLLSAFPAGTKKMLQRSAGT